MRNERTTKRERKLSGCGRRWLVLLLLVSLLLPMAPAVPAVTTLAAEETQREQVESFVKRLYTILLGRDVDASGLKYWTDVLVAGQDTGANVAAGIVCSAELKGLNLGSEEYLNRLYKTVLNRDADTAGMAYWLSVLKQGESRESVGCSLLNSAEFGVICEQYGITQGTAVVPGNSGGNASTGASKEQVENFVTRLYTILLGRAVDNEGRNYWTGVLVNQLDTGARVAGNIVFSDELWSLNLSNEEYIVRLYKTVFDREPDAAGRAYWVNVLKGGEPREKVGMNMLNSAEFGSICEQYGIIQGLITEVPTLRPVLTPTPTPILWEYEVIDKKVEISAYVGTETTVTVPDTIEEYPVTSIGKEAFVGTAVVDVTLPDTITSIGASAFRNCQSLKTVELPFGLERIGNTAFYNCNALESLKLPSTLTSFGAEWYTKEAGKAACTMHVVEGSYPEKYCKENSLTYVSSNPKVAETRDFCVGDVVLLGAYEQDNNFANGDEEIKWIVTNSTTTMSGKTYRYLVSYYVLDSKAYEGLAGWLTEEFKESAFSTAEKKHIYNDDDNPKVWGSYESYLPADFLHTKPTAFAEANGVGMNLETGNAPYWTRDNKYYQSSSAHYLISDKSTSSTWTYDTDNTVGVRPVLMILEEMPDTTVKSNAAWEYELINDKLEISAYIGTEASVTVPAKIGGYPVTSIGKEAFAGTTVTDVTLPDTVVSIGASAFRNCQWLRTVDIPFGLKRIGNTAFYNCNALENLELPSTLTSFGSEWYTKEAGKTACTMYVVEGSYAEKHCKENSLTYVSSNPKVTETRDFCVGDVVLLGAYEQDNNFANGDEEIKWIVTKSTTTTSGRTYRYLVSYYVLDSKAYEGLAGWLTEEFKESAFSTAEKKHIYNDADNPKVWGSYESYLPADFLHTKPTAFAEANGVGMNLETGNAPYWTSSQYGWSAHYLINDKSTSSTWTYDTDNTVGVRPVLMVLEEMPE